MKSLIVAWILVLILAATAYAGTAYYIGEKSSGMYKVCYYVYLGETVSVTRKTTQVCPLTIKID